MPRTVFIAFDGADAGFAKELHKHLAGVYGLEVTTKSNILPGNTVAVRYWELLTAADLFFIVLSSDVFYSENDHTPPAYDTVLRDVLDNTPPENVFFIAWRRCLYLDAISERYHSRVFGLGANGKGSLSLLSPAERDDFLSELALSLR